LSFSINEERLFESSPASIFSLGREDVVDVSTVLPEINKLHIIYKNKISQEE
jgi:hypothetical protein